MSKDMPDRISILKLELEEAIQLLRLVAEKTKTPDEVKEWLSINYPLPKDIDSDLFDFLGIGNE